MRTRQASLRFALLVLLGCSLLVAPAQASDDGPALRADALPVGWKLAQELRIPKEQLPAFGQRLGGGIEDLWNQVVSVGGLRVRVNTILCADEKAAEAILGTMVSLRGKDYVQRSGRRVIEVAGQSVLFARRIWAALALGPESAVWTVSFQAACVDELDYTEANRVFNLFLSRRGSGISAVDKQIREITEDWTFGSSLRLLGDEPPHLDVTWTFDPAPVGEKKDGRGTRYAFEDLPRIAGVPYVNVRGKLRVHRRFVPSDAAASGQTRTPTTWWPAADERIKVVASEVVKGAPTPRERLTALLAHANRAIRYGGDVGTRDGVRAVLDRGYGRCWDRADALVTLCRAIDLPARQVAGWVPPLGAGHIWTEVHLEGEGWLPVDATTPWLGVSVDYLPFYDTEDGRMPVVYLSMPEALRVE